MRECLQHRRLHWSRHLEIIEDSAWSSKCRNIKVCISFPIGRPRKTWNEVIRSDVKETKVTKDLADNRNACKSFARNRPTQANMEA